jgi:antitoxin YefM
MSSRLKPPDPVLDNIPILLYSNTVQVQERSMTIQTTYSQARANLATLLDRVTHDREVIVIQRRGEEDVAMISADELTSLMETAYLLQSPKNAERLLTALARSLKNEGGPQTINDLRREINLDQDAT